VSGQQSQHGWWLDALRVLLGLVALPRVQLILDSRVYFLDRSWSAKLPSRVSKLRRMTRKALRRAFFQKENATGMLLIVGLFPSQRLIQSVKTSKV
jgi:hypothetical protein